MRYLGLYLRWLACRREARRWVRANGLPVVMRAMWTLNRHARLMGRWEASPIYALKDLLIRELWRQGVPCQLTRQVQTFVCWGCGGAGCERCDWSGDYRRVYHYVFRFSVQGRRYIWHQPVPLAPWVDVTAPLLGEWQPRPARSPAPLPQAACSVLKATVWEWLHTMGVPAEELPAVPTLRRAVREVAVELGQGLERQAWRWRRRVSVKGDRSCLPW